MAVTLLAVIFPVGTALAADQCANELGTDGCFSTIQEAVDTADPGDTVTVEAGTYAEQVVIDKPLTLQGESGAIIRPTTSDLTSLYPMGTQSGAFWNGETLASAILVDGVGAAGVTIRNLTVNGEDITGPAGAAHVSGITFGESGGSIENVVVENTNQVSPASVRTYSIWLDAVATDVTVDVTNSDAVEYGRNGINARGNSMTANVTNNTITGPGTVDTVQVPNGVLLISGAGGTVTGNTITANHHTGSAFLGSGILLFNAASGIEVSGNDINDVDDAVLLAGTASAQVLFNELYNNVKGVQIEAAGAINNTIANNSIQSNNGWGIFLAASAGAGNSAAGNLITNNSTAGVNNESAFPFNAEDNWWNNATGPTHTGNPGGTGDSVTGTGAVDYVPFCVNIFCTPPPLCVGAGACFANIQDAVDAASAGATITVDSGIYNEQVTIPKSVHLVGQGDSTEISHTGAGPIVTVTGDNVTLENLKVDKEGGVGTASGCRQNPTVPSNGRGVSVEGASVESLSLQDVTITGATDGFAVGTVTDVDGLTIDSSNFDGNCIGVYLAKDNANTSNVTNMTVTDSTFNNNQIKGIYAEKLSAALFDGITVSNSGVDPLYGFNAGIDINLKWDDYSDITIRDSSVTGSGLTGTEPNPFFPAGITIKARDDASGYHLDPATLDGVLLDNVDVSGGVVGVRFGEAGKINAGPTNVRVLDSSLSGTGGYAIVNETLTTVDAADNWWGSDTGPTHASNPGGTGATVDDLVDFAPWCMNSACTTPTPPPPPTPTPTPTPTDPGGGDIVTPPGADPLPPEECNPETELCGSTGDDDADINDGTVITGPGEDHIDIDTDGDTQQVTVNAGPDNDTVILNVGEGTPDGTVIEVDGGEGDDTIIVNLPEGTTNVEIIIIGGDGDDTITYPGLEGLDGVTITTTTGDGDDVVNVPPSPGTVRIVIRLGSGADAVVVNTGVGAPPKGASGAAVTGGYDIYGGAGPELIEGSTGADFLSGGRGRDSVFGKRGADVLKGGKAVDRLFGGFGNDTIFGGKGKDVARGGPGNDQLIGI